LVVFVVVDQGTCTVNTTGVNRRAQLVRIQRWVAMGKGADLFHTGSSCSTSTVVNVALLVVNALAAERIIDEQCRRADAFRHRRLRRPLPHAGGANVDRTTRIVDERADEGRIVGSVHAFVGAKLVDAKVHSANGGRVGAFVRVEAFSIGRFGKSGVARTRTSFLVSRELASGIVLTFKV
jgi:hypothetical protein